MKANRIWLAVHLECITRTSHALQSLTACAVAVALLLAAIPSRAAEAPADGGKPGPYPIGHISFLTKVGNTGRWIAGDVYYPANARAITAQSPGARYPIFPYENTTPYMTSSQWEALGYDRAYEAPAPAQGPFPLIVFGTGQFTPGWGYLYFGTRLASHGYIVVVAEAYRDGIWVPSNTSDWFSQKLYYRPRDMSAVLSEMLARNLTAGDLLQNTIDQRYLVAAGHSLGGYAAFTEFCGDDQVCDTTEIARLQGDKKPAASICVATPPDRRFTALMTLDGHAMPLRWEELSRIRVPSLILGSAFWADGAFAPWVGPAFGLADTALDSSVARPHAAIWEQTRSVRVDLRGVEHGAFADVWDGLPILYQAGLLSAEDYAMYMRGQPGAYGLPLVPKQEIHRMVTKYAVAWLKAEVVKDGTPLSQHILTQAYTKAFEPNVELYWDEPRPAGVTIPPEAFAYWTNMAPNAWTIEAKNPAGYFVPYR
jgi:hypothetical protein